MLIGLWILHRIFSNGAPGLSPKAVVIILVLSAAIVVVGFIMLRDFFDNPFFFLFHGW